MIREKKTETEKPQRREASGDKRRPGKKQQTEEQKSTGPTVVKVTKARKLVAAGLAEQVEIQAEIESSQAEDTAKDSE